MLSDDRKARSLRIHGDNILECERAMLLICDAFSASIRQIPGPIYSPRYEILDEGERLFTVDLFPGYGRWNVNLQEVLQSFGAPLREAVDAIVTEVLSDGKEEQIILAFEFCNALPAGNNAWQRNGRALACAAMGIPYLFFAEIGGVELGANRRIKAPRFPNPIVPFSYLAAAKAFGVVCLPVYSTSASSSGEIRTQFATAFGLEDGKRLIRGIIGNALEEDSQENLKTKALTLVEILATSRKGADTLRGGEWSEFLDLETVESKAQWLERKNIAWTRKGAGKVVVTSTLPKLLSLFLACGGVSIGARSIPLCLIPGGSRNKLAEGLLKIYGEEKVSALTEWLSKSKDSLIIILITGFKPRGDDSRPDRGLVPLARMLFGSEAQILSVVYGPAKPAMWEILRQSPQQLAKQNGLWEAILNLSDAVLVDSTTSGVSPFALILQRTPRRTQDAVKFSAASLTAEFSEHDVDSTLHGLFARKLGNDVFEALCNPPGGDWSGLSLWDFKTKTEYRWTSLPRVSGAGGKRPDHVIQFSRYRGKTTLLAIESKNRPSDLEQNIGSRLKTYTRQLVGTHPVAIRVTGEEWRLRQKNDAKPSSDFLILSGGAFCWTSARDLENVQIRGDLDIVFGVEFRSVEQPTLLHIRARGEAVGLLPKVDELARQNAGNLEIQIH